MAAEEEEEEKKGIELARKKTDSLFHKYNLAEKLEAIEKAEEESNFAKVIEFSTKLQFLFKLLDNFRAEGHRVLIFSMSKKMLTVIENIITSGFYGNGKLKYTRIDGDTEIQARE